MFLTPGGYNSLSVNHFWGIIGLGLMGGYQNFGVSDDYKGINGGIANVINTYNVSRPISERIVPSSVKYDTQGNYEDFYLLIGPALALPVGKKFNIDIDLKGGLKHRFFKFKTRF